MNLELSGKAALVTGSSQGGGLTLVAAGRWDGFESAESRKPGLCRLDWNLTHLQPPFFPIAVNEYSRPEIEKGPYTAWRRLPAPSASGARWT